MNNILLIKTWGYWLIFGASIIEGETFLVLGGIAAASKILNLPIIIILSIIGCMIHDTILFYLGKISSNRIKYFKSVKWKNRTLKINRLLKKYDFWIIITLRFAYGIRTIIPLTLGINKCITDFKFLVFDFIGAVIWVAVFILSGYYFGSVLQISLENFSLYSLFNKYKGVILVSLALMIVLVVVLIIIKIVRKYRSC